MLKRTLTYTDFDGNEVTREFHFHMSKAEMLKWHMVLEADGKGGLEQYIHDESQSKNGERIIALFDTFLRKSIGEKSNDGLRFTKTPEITGNFMDSEAYAALLFELVMDADAASNFINGIMPANLGEEMNKLVQQGEANRARNRPQPQDFKKKQQPYRDIPVDGVPGPITQQAIAEQQDRIDHIADEQHQQSEQVETVSYPTQDAPIFQEGSHGLPPAPQSVQRLYPAQDPNQQG